MKRLYWIALFVAALAIAGCANKAPSAERVVFNTSSTLVSSVDLAMIGWGKYVVAKREEIKKMAVPELAVSAWYSLDAKEAKVRSAYEKYRAAATAAILVAAQTGANPPQLSADELLILIATLQN